MEEFPIDVTRLYITGLSMGGYGSWDMITFSPFRFAANVLFGIGNNRLRTTMGDIADFG
jgi:predicted peptidase